MPFFSRNKYVASKASKAIERSGRSRGWTGGERTTGTIYESAGMMRHCDSPFPIDEMGYRFNFAVLDILLDIQIKVGAPAPRILLFDLAERMSRAMADLFLGDKLDPAVNTLNLLDFPGAYESAIV